MSSKNLTVFIDADGCPVVNETAKICKKYNVECVIICDTSHLINISGAKTIVVEKGPDSADFKLVNSVKSGDICITQDYALAAMCLAKKARVINQNGMEYTESNIDGLLFLRYVSKKIRSAGGRIKGPSKRTPEQTQNFIKTLEKMLQSE